jgi:hypothetical protein
MTSSSTQSEWISARSFVAYGSRRFVSSSTRFSIESGRNSGLPSGPTVPLGSSSCWRSATVTSFVFSGSRPQNVRHRWYALTSKPSTATVLSTFSIS